MKTVDSEIEFLKWWGSNIGIHRGHHYDDVKYGYMAGAKFAQDKTREELSLKDMWVKHHQLSVQEHLSREHVLKEDIKELEQELHQQRFNNEHNLSIDQKVSDEMDRLRKELREAREVIGFYGNTENWAASKDEPFWSIYKDEEEIDKELFGGKRARKFLNKYPDIMSIQEQCNDIANGRD